MLKVLVCMIVIAFIESCVAAQHKSEGKDTTEMEGAALEISLAILMGAWLISGGNLLW